MALPNSKSNAGILVPMIVILVASAVAGFTYNRATPLGVRFDQTVEKAQPVSPSPVAQVTNTPPAKTTNYVAMPEGAGPMPTPKYPIPALTWKEVRSLLAAQQNFTLVDARAHLSYDAEHIPGAICIPSGSNFDMSNFSEEHTNKAELIVVYCSSEHCPLSWLVANGLINNFGFTNVKIMPGGFDEYRRAETGSRKEQPK
jgi:rhodanese-related sulfurtransferase